MTSKRKIICDECGKVADGYVGNNQEALGWFWIKQIKGGYRGTGAKDTHINFNMSDEDDPDFCSIDCATKWLEGFLKKAMNKRNKMYKGFKMR